MAQVVISKHEGIWDILKMSAWGEQGWEYEEHWAKCDDETQKEM